MLRHGRTPLMQTVKNTRDGTSPDLPPDASIRRLVTRLSR